jgi:DNA repair ATPase RecN
MPKYHFVNSRTERCRNRNTNKDFFDLKNIISKKNNFIVELRKNLDNFRSENTYLDNTYKFLYNMYYKLYNDFEELSGAYTRLKNDKEELYGVYNKLKNDKEDLEKKYKDLLDEFVEKEIKIEN